MTMTIGLAGAHMRRERAREHLPYLEGFINGIHQLYADGVLAHRNPASGEWVPSDSVGEPLQLRAGIVVGEIVYNLRAALDYLVYELVWLDTGEEPGRTQFLIEDTENQFAGRAKSLLEGLSEEHVAIVRHYQPFRGCEWTRTLRDLSNPDKHRQLVEVEVDFTLTGGRIVVDFDAYQGGLQLDAEGKLANEAVDMYLRGTANVVLPDGSGVISTLDELQTQVGLLLASFAHEFEWMTP